MKSIADLRKKLVSKASSNSYYRQLWSGYDLLDFEALPAASRNLFPTGAEDIPPESSYIYFSSGSASSPRMIPLTEEEWQARASYRAEMYRNAGVTSHDVVVIVLPFGPWVAGPSALAALERIRCKAVPVGLNDSLEKSAEFLRLMDEVNATVLITAPSALQTLIQSKSDGQDVQSLRTVITSGERLDESLRAEVFSTFGAACYSSFAMSEGFIGIECSEFDGFHFDPGKVDITHSADGNSTLLSFFDSAAVPVVKYKTDDYLSLVEESCPCGNPLPRFRFGGRRDLVVELAGAVGVDVRTLFERLCERYPGLIRADVLLSTVGPGVDEFAVRITVARNSRLSEEPLSQIEDELRLGSVDLLDAVDHGQVRLTVQREAVDTPIPLKMQISLQDHRTYAR